MTLGELIKWLESQNKDMVIKDGFGSPHSDRGFYNDLAFSPEENSRIEDMLKNAKDAVGQTFQGYKGGDFTMSEYTNVLIGEWGECGEEITSTHLKYWLLTAA